MVYSVSKGFEIEPSWERVLKEEWYKPYFQDLQLFLARERKNGTPIYPPDSLVFNAFWKTPYDKVKAVILGQDPYHGPGQAHGLCFSVPKGVPAPPSLVNIFKEIQADLSIAPPSHGCLSDWAAQGVFLLNTTMTVKESEPMSHHGKGWEHFTDAVIKSLAQKHEPIVFMLWGKSAQEKAKEALAGAQNKHLILTAPHPSPFSAYQGFFGSHHFSKANEFLKDKGVSPINWQLR